MQREIGGVPDKRVLSKYSLWICTASKSRSERRRHRVGGARQRSTENQVRQRGVTGIALLAFQPESWKRKQCGTLEKAFVPTAIADTALGTLPERFLLMLCRLDAFRGSPLLACTCSSTNTCQVGFGGYTNKIMSCPQHDSYALALAEVCCAKSLKVLSYGQTPPPRVMGVG
jgi:hypothetical protein